MITETKCLVFLLALMICAVARGRAHHHTANFGSITYDDVPIVPPGTLDIEGNNVDGSRIVKTLYVNNGAYWGTWDSMSFCPPGSFASGYNMKIEPWQVNSDDTSLNAIKIICTNIVGLSLGGATSKEGPFGDWGNNTFCEEHSTSDIGDFMIGFKLQVESRQYEGDDTAANYVRFMCRGLTQSNNHKYEIVRPPGEGPWGTWGLWSRLCPIGTAICGIQTKVEDWQGSGDDTALNDVKFFCCSH